MGLTYWLPTSILPRRLLTSIYQYTSSVERDINIWEDDCDGLRTRRLTIARFVLLPDLKHVVHGVFSQNVITFAHEIVTHSIECSVMRISSSLTGRLY